MDNIINRLLNLLVAVVLFSLISSGCSDSSDRSKTAVSNIDSIKMVFNHLSDSSNVTWKLMIEEDDQKIAYLKRLLDEVSYTKLYDKNSYDSLSKAVENLKQIRYDLNSMVDSEKIDAYDETTAAVINKVFVFAQHHPKFDDYPLMAELINDILEADNKIIYRRVDYDNIALAYNKFIEVNTEILSKAGFPSSQKPLFQISE